MLAEEQEHQEYQEHVAALFTKPFLEGDDLLANLTQYWPGDASENFAGLLELGFIERAPSGRYRLPLVKGLLGKVVPEPARKAPAKPVAPTVTAPVSAPPIAVTAQPVLAAESAPAARSVQIRAGLPPLRLNRPTAPLQSV